MTHRAATSVYRRAKDRVAQGPECLDTSVRSVVGYTGAYEPSRRAVALLPVHKGPRLCIHVFVADLDIVDLSKEERAASFVRMYTSVDKFGRAVQVGRRQVQLIHQTTRKRSNGLGRYQLALDGLGWLHRVMPERVVVWHMLV